MAANEHSEQDARPTVSVAESKKHLISLLREQAATIRLQDSESRRVHPELATPGVLAFWLSSFRNIAKAYADDLENRADCLEVDRG